MAKAKKSQRSRQAYAKKDVKRTRPRSRPRVDKKISGKASKAFSDIAKPIKKKKRRTREQIIKDIQTENASKYRMLKRLGFQFKDAKSEQNVRDYMNLDVNKFSADLADPDKSDVVYEQLKKELGTWFKQELAENMVYEIDKIKDTFNLDGRPLDAPIKDERLTVKRFSNARGRAAIINDFLKTKIPVTKKGVSTMIHVTSDWEASNIITILGFINPQYVKDLEEAVKTGAAIENEYFKLKEGWKRWSDLGNYIRFKKLPDDPYIKDILIDMSQYAFYNRELYDVYAERKRNRALSDFIDDTTLSIMSTIIQTDRLYYILKRDVRPSEIEEEAKFMMKNLPKLRAKNIAFFNDIASDIDNGDSYYRIKEKLHRYFVALKEKVDESSELI